MIFKPLRNLRLRPALALSLSAACLSGCMVGRPYSIAMAKPTEAQTLFVVGEANETGGVAPEERAGEASSSSGLTSNMPTSLANVPSRALVSSQSVATAIHRVTASEAILVDAIAQEGLTSAFPVVVIASTPAAAVQVNAPVSSTTAFLGAAFVAASAPVASTTVLTAVSPPPALASVVVTGTGSGVGAQAALLGFNAAAALSAPSLNVALGALANHKTALKRGVR